MSIEGFTWHCPPDNFNITGPNSIDISTNGQTDFWQRTFYNFEVDNGHFYYKIISGDFVISAHTKINPKAQYDQCGLMVRIDEKNWIKASCEYENDQTSNLGSVVTNNGYSDWAKQEIPSSQNEVWYKLQRMGSDFSIKISLDGKIYTEIRLAHLINCENQLKVGIYACSPKQAGYTCTTDEIKIE